MKPSTTLILSVSTIEFYVVEIFEHFTPLILVPQYLRYGIQLTWFLDHLLPMFGCACECTRNIIHRPCDSLDFNASRSEAEKCLKFEYVLPHDKWVPNCTWWRCRKGKQGRGVSLCEEWDHKGVYCIVICYLLPCYFLFMFYIRISFAIFLYSVAPISPLWF